MTPYYTDDAVSLYHGDALDITRQLDRYVQLTWTQRRRLLRRWTVADMEAAQRAVLEQAGTVKDTPS